MRDGRRACYRQRGESEVHCIDPAEETGSPAGTLRVCDFFGTYAILERINQLFSASVLARSQRVKSAQSRLSTALGANNAGNSDANERGARCGEDFDRCSKL